MWLDTFVFFLQMNKEEKTEVEHLIQRIQRIVEVWRVILFKCHQINPIQEVKKHEGRAFIDAEQSYFQTAIHKLALELQEQYNRERIIVYNTYQCYRKVH